MPTDPRAIIAADNNADLYAAMFSAHGLRHSRHSYAFVGHDSPPPFYSNLTVLAPDHIDQVVEELKTISAHFPDGMGLKDSFSQLDLTAQGFETLFHASWIWRNPVAASLPPGWHRIETDTDLLLWEQAWKATGSPTEHRMFKDTMLALPDFRFFGQKTDGIYVAGCIANLSDNCIGLSNVFTRNPTPEFFVAAAAAAGSTRPDLPIAGYESGDALDDALGAGFETVGDLRILVSRSPQF